MKKLNFYLLLIALLLFPGVCFAYETDFYEIQINPAFTKSADDEYWTLEEDDSISSIFISVEDNTESINLRDYQEEELTQSTYIEALKEKFSLFNTDTEIEFTAIQFQDIGTYFGLRMDISLSYSMSDGSINSAYQRQYIFTSNNYIYYITMSSSENKQLDSAMFSSVIESFHIKDETSFQKSFSWSVAIVGILAGMVLVLIYLIIRKIHHKRNR